MPGTATPIIVPLRGSIDAGSEGPGGACAGEDAASRSLAVTPIIVRFILGTPAFPDGPGAALSITGGAPDVLLVGSAEEGSGGPDETAGECGDV